MTSTAPSPSRVPVTALGGGTGLATVLRALRQLTRDVTAIASVADDGGSTGRLRRDLGLPAPGDVRKCLVALATAPSPWPETFAHRFESGELDGHVTGNLLLAGLTETTGDFARAIDCAAALLQVIGRVLPASIDPVVLKARTDGSWVEGQVAIQTTESPISRLELVPADARAHPDSSGAIANAEVVLLAPGSLFTSLLPVLCMRDLAAAIGSTRAQVVQIANLRSREPETAGLDGTDQLRIVLDHGVRVDALLYDPELGAPVDPEAVRALGVEPVPGPVARADGLAHDPARLVEVLAPRFR